MPTGTPKNVMTTEDVDAESSEKFEKVEVVFDNVGEAREYYVQAPAREYVPLMLRNGAFLGTEARPPNVGGKGRVIVIPTGAIRWVVLP